MRIRILVTVLGTFVGAATAQAGLINGAFEAGDLSGWTTFTTANGTLGGAGSVVVPFDTKGDGASTNSARFRVGEATHRPSLEGGGIFQGVTLGAGSLAISADIAAWAPQDNRNGGLFELLFDGLVVASHDFGGIGADSVERAVLLASFDVGEGVHEVGLRVTRPWLESDRTPLQFVDNVSLVGVAVSSSDAVVPPAPVPEPGSITLLSLGLLGLARARRRAR